MFELGGAGTNLTLKNISESKANVYSKNSVGTHVRPWVPFPQPQKHKGHDGVKVTG